MQNLPFDANRVLDALAERSYAVIPDALPRELSRALLEVLKDRWAKGHFAAAKIGQGMDQQKQKSIRSDSIHWLDFQDESPALQSFFALIRELTRRLNRGLFLSINAFESHFACYEPGAFYQKHVDRFRSDNGRRLSLVFFLNDNWQAADAGELVIYDPQDEAQVLARIPPQLGTLVLFVSDRIVHEVLPTQSLRFSLTGWFKSMPDHEAVMQGIDL